MGKKFEIQKFEHLECSSEVLKGGFSLAYASGGATAPIDPKIIINLSKGCSCINTCNIVVGCNCPATPKE